MNPQQPDTATSLRDEARELLRRLTGASEADFHDGQYEAIHALVADRARTLVVQRTGWGPRSTSSPRCSCAPGVPGRHSSSPRCFRSCATRWPPHPARGCAPPW